MLQRSASGGVRGEGAALGVVELERGVVFEAACDSDHTVDGGHSSVGFIMRAVGSEVVDVLAVAGIGDAGVAHLRELTKLRRLNLFYSTITDRA